LPETEVTREQLLASVHALEPGDVLIVRVPADTPGDHVRKLADSLRSKLMPSSLGVQVLVMAGAESVEVLRPARVVG
jgi:hypothetical protein